MFTLLRKCIIASALTSVCFFSFSCENNVTVSPTIPEEGLPEPEQEPPPQDPTTELETTAVVYTIKKDSHYATSNPFMFSTNNIVQFEATFNPTAIYQTLDAENQGDINKLYGVSDCYSAHHTNSARFGWRWYGNRLEIHAYAYVNGTRQSVYIGDVELDKASTYKLELKDELYVFTLDDKQVTLPRACSGSGSGYKLYPYFGGDETAPHDITIEIKEML